MQVYFGMLDALLASEELPEEYRDRCQVNCPGISKHSYALFGNTKTDVYGPGYTLQWLWQEGYGTIPLALPQVQFLWVI